MAGPMPELGAREQVEDRLGHDVRRRVAHRVELAVRRRRPAARRPSRARGASNIDSSRQRLLDGSIAVARPPSSDSFENHETPRPSAGREVCPPAVPPAFAAHWCRRPRGRANGRTPDRFAGRSRVVPVRSRSPGFQPWPGSLEIGRIDRRVPLDAVHGDVVGDTGLEPVTSCMSSKCSNQLS